LKLKPIIGITMGDAAGIGPEIIAKTLSLNELYDVCRPIVIGDADVMTEGVKTASVQLKLRLVDDVSKAAFIHGSIDVLDLHNVNVLELKMGGPQAMAGKASVEYVEKAVKLALSGQVQAIVTAPISKEAVHLAGFSYSGHTEMLAQFTGTSDYAMMLTTGPLRVIHVTTHVPLSQVPELIKKDRVLRAIQLAYKTMLGLSIDEPRIAVAALNPHRGEGGLFGMEEVEEIIPAVEEARRMGMGVKGPISADTVFARAIGGAYDVVVAMYHDQGHIPVKLQGHKWDEAAGKWVAVAGVNVTVGLPIIRTSVDHGTAYGKAGRREGTANPQSLIEAVKLAVKLAEAKGVARI